MPEALIAVEIAAIVVSICNPPVCMHKLNCVFWYKIDLFLIPVYKKYTLTFLLVYPYILQKPLHKKNVTPGKSLRQVRIIHAFTQNNIFVQMYLILISFQFYNYMTVRLFTFTDSLYKFISLKSRMDDSSFIRIHWFKNNRFSGFLYLVGNSSCQIFQCLFSSSAVIFCIQFYPDIGRFTFIHNKTCQILKRIKVCPLFPIRIPISCPSKSTSRQPSFVLYFEVI